jgi:hypothetical protein
LPSQAKPFIGRKARAIEVKHYRTWRRQPHLLEAAAARVANRNFGSGKRLGMLVVSCYLPAGTRQALERKFGITFIDRSNLEAVALKDPLLAEQLQELLGSTPDSFMAPETNPPIRSRQLPQALGEVLHRLPFSRNQRQ